MKEKINNLLKDIVLPSYDEGTIFLLNFVFILTFFFDRKCRTEILNFYSPPEGSDNRALFFIILITLILISGVVTSFYHAFSKGEKDILSETLMKFSAMFMNGLAGILCGFYILDNDINWIIVSPTWNIIMGAVLLYQIGFIDSVYMDQKDASILQVLVGIVLCSGIFYICFAIFNYSWQITFSIGVNFVTSTNHFISKGPMYLKSFLVYAQK